MNEISQFMTKGKYGILTLLNNIRKIIRDRRKYKRVGDDKLFFKNFDGLTFALYLDREIHHQLFHGYFEQHIEKFIKMVVKENDYCLDVGANIGYYSCLMGNLIGEKGKVFAFEPVHYNLKILNTNIMLNRLKNVSVCSNALGESTGEMEMKIYPENSFLTGHNSLIDNEVIKENQFYETKSINVVSIDEYLEKNKIERIDVVKIDIEGYEYNFFLGAKKLMTDFNPIIIFEHNPNRIKDIGISEDEFIILFKNYFVYELFEDGLKPYYFDRNITAPDLVAIPKIKTDEILCKI